MLTSLIRASAIEIDFTVPGSFSDDDDERDFYRRQGDKETNLFLNGNSVVSKSPIARRKG